METWAAKYHDPTAEGASSELSPVTAAAKVIDRRGSIGTWADTRPCLCDGACGHFVDSTA